MPCHAVFPESGANRKRIASPDAEQPMKILIYSHYFLPSVGGVERVVESLARGFSGRGHQVTVATETPATADADSGLPYRVHRRPGLVFLARLIARNDVVHLAGPALLPMLLARLIGRPVVVEHHMYQAICPNGLLVFQPTRAVCPGHFQAGRHRECRQCNRGLGRWASWRMWLLAFPRLWLCRGVSANVAVTEHVRRRLRLPKTRVIYHGVPRAAASEADNGSASRDHAPARFAYVGRFVSEKGLPSLIEAAARLKEEGRLFELLFIGDGPERAKLEAAASGCGLEDRTIFTGMLRGDALRRATANLTAVVMPSVWEETAGMAAIEQMMRGRVVIASDIGGLGEIVDHAGLKFPPGDTEALALCMRRVMDDPEFARAVGEKAQRRACSSFLIERRLDEHAQLCAEVLRKG